MSPPDKPGVPGRFSRLEPIVEENVATGPHTPVPLVPPDEAPRARPAPAMPTQRGAPAPPSERRPVLSNPPPDDLAKRSHHDIEIELADDRPSTIEFKEAIRVQHGRLRLVVPWVVVAAAISAVGTYYGAHAAQAATPPNDEVINRLTKLEQKIDQRNTLQDVDYKLLVSRVGALESKVGAVDETTTQILLNLRNQPQSSPR